MQIVFWLFAFLIFWAMIGYKISLKIIYKIRNKNDTVKIKGIASYPTVSIMVVAHNEEKIIKDKLINLISLKYPKEKIEYIVASDNSTDDTEKIVNEFINSHLDIPIKLYSTKEHKGKTNAQNEAQKICSGEILVMTDANSIFKEDAIIELVKSFDEKDIYYVCGKLEYINTENDTARSESSYWNQDLQMRYIESSISTITAGNGAIYACRNKEYIIIPDIESHDLYMPYIYGKNGKRAVYNENAIAYEKAGESDSDEFKRKVRMNRNILNNIIDGLKVINIFKYGWFAYFFFGHRTCRYLLWISHFMLFICNIVLLSKNIVYKLIFACQLMFFLIGMVGCVKGKNKGIFHMVSYYCMTIFAQICGAQNAILGKSKATWNITESTR